MTYVPPKWIRCPLPRSGWYCTRLKGHSGPCPTYPRWWVRAMHKVTGKWW